jgi:two-component system sensor histidine kinase KdpD
MAQYLTERQAPAWIYPLQKLRVPGQLIVVCSGIALLTYGGTVLRVNLTTISFLNLLLVLLVALRFGFWQASFTSLLAVACLDYFFSPPLYRFNITDPQDWVALGAFEFTAILVSRLSAKELRNAGEAIIHRQGMEQLYELSRSSLLLNLHHAPGPQLVVLLQRIFNANAVALYDASLKRMDRIGDWEVSEEELIQQCYSSELAQENPEAQTVRRKLQSNHGTVGALVVRGNLSPLVMDAIASLAAIAIDRHQSFENEDKAEKKMQSEQLRTAVLDSLAHEFKTPLSAIQTASAGLQELGGLGELQADLTNLIEREVVRLNELCTKLLRTAKLEAKEVGLQTASVNVRNLILEVVSSRELDQDRKRLKVAVENSALTVRGDPGLLATILTHYIDNARKYSKPGTKIQIEAQESRTEVLISVHNFGSTISLDDRERIFERFYRSPNSRDTVPGTGVGLSIVKKAAEANQGHVWVVSDDNEGTTFYLSLPNGARSEK